MNRRIAGPGRLPVGFLELAVQLQGPVPGLLEGQRPGLDGQQLVTVLADVDAASRTVL